MIIDPLINEPIDFYFNEDGQIVLEYLNNGNTDFINLEALADDLTNDYTTEDGPQAPLTRAQVQHLLAASGRLSAAANRINDFVRKYGPR